MPKKTRVKTYTSPFKSEIFRRALDFARQAHRGQKRQTGEDYIAHPLAVANILAEMHLDEETIAAAILHDTVEDARVPIKEISQKFGPTIANLVQGVTKLDRLSFSGESEDYSIENLRHMFLAMSQDIRVVLIKLADRLHNMRSLAFKDQNAQIRIARETLDIYAPVAERLCMGEFKGILEDLAFPYAYPEEYKWIKDHMTKAYEYRHRVTEQTKRSLRKQLALKQVKFYDIHGRAKHLFSLYKKLLLHNMDVTQIYDLVAVRVVVRDIDECYKALGVIHQKWKPLPNRIKDYIATPKPNGYRSLHTTIISNIEEEIVEVQIRTPQMHAEAEYGVAAHWYYKHQLEASKQMAARTWNWFSVFKKNRNGPGSFQNLPWIKQIAELKDEVRKPRDFLKSIQSDVLKNRILVLTPTGDIRTLPTGSTPVDFAYSIHTDIGHSCIGAKINNELVPLNVKINNGDVVKIITSRMAKGPKRQWLEFVVTANARNKILEWYKSIDAKENIKYGREALADALEDRYQLTLSKAKAKLVNVQNKLLYKTLPELFGAIGRGELTAHQVIDQMFPEKAAPKPGEILVSLDKNQTVLINGQNLAVDFGNCCQPKEGDPITARVADNHIVVHKNDCAELKNTGAAYLIKIQWAKETEQLPQATLLVESFSRNGLLRDVADALAKAEISILSFSVKHLVAGDPRLIGQLTVEYEKAKDLEEAMQAIRKIKNIISVKKDK